MVTTQMKTDAQRLGNGKKAFNVKQVEKMIEQGGGGTEYAAGTGIVIAEDEISIDEQIVALKSEIPSEWKIAPKDRWGDYLEGTITNCKALKDIMFVGLSSGQTPFMNIFLKGMTFRNIVSMPLANSIFRTLEFDTWAVQNNYVNYGKSYGCIIGQGTGPDTGNYYIISDSQTSSGYATKIDDMADLANSTIMMLYKE